MPSYLGPHEESKHSLMDAQAGELQGEGNLKKDSEDSDTYLFINESEDDLRASNTRAHRHDRTMHRHNTESLDTPNELLSAELIDSFAVIGSPQRMVVKGSSPRRRLSSPTMARPRNELFSRRTI